MILATVFYLTSYFIMQIIDASYRANKNTPNLPRHILVFVYFCKIVFVVVVVFAFV